MCFVCSKLEISKNVNALNVFSPLAGKMRSNLICITCSFFLPTFVIMDLQYAPAYARTLIPNVTHSALAEFTLCIFSIIPSSFLNMNTVRLQSESVLSGLISTSVNPFFNNFLAVFAVKITIVSFFSM